MSAKDTSPPTLAQIRERIDDADKDSWYDAHADRRELLRLLDEAHAQIDGLMKRLLKSEANERRYLWLRSGGPGTGLYVADAEREWVEVDGEELDELVDDALSAQGGGDG